MRWKKERLQKIKNDIIPSNDRTPFMDWKEDVIWLIEQVEKRNELIERYEEVLKNIRLTGDDYSRAMAKGVLNGTLKVVTEKDLGVD